MERIHRAEMELRNVVGNTTQLQKLSLARYVSFLSLSLEILYCVA